MELPKKMAPTIFFIGTGITSALTASLIQKSYPNVEILLCDKARGPGGRMSVSYDSSNKSSRADLGAQYITTTPENMQKNQDIYSSLLKDELIRKLNVPIVGMKAFKHEVNHFVAPEGMSSLVKYFLKNINQENVFFKTLVTGVEVKNDKYNIYTENQTYESNIVVSTMPVPQFLNLKGAIDKNDKYYQPLENITYTSRFAIILFYDKNSDFPKMDWACNYLNHEIFCFVSIDNLKRDQPDQPIAVIFHTNAEFGKKNLEKTLPEMEVILLESIKKIFPDWPKPSSVKCHKWRYSQVKEGFPGKPGLLVLRENPTMILGGDAFSESNFDGCLFSAKKIFEFISTKYLV